MCAAESGSTGSRHRSRRERRNERERKTAAERGGAGEDRGAVQREKVRWERDGEREAWREGRCVDDGGRDATGERSGVEAEMMGG